MQSVTTYLTMPTSVVCVWLWIKLLCITHTQTHTHRECRQLNQLGWCVARKLAFGNLLFPLSNKMKDWEPERQMTSAHRHWLQTIECKRHVLIALREREPKRGRKRERMCCSKRGLYWRYESAVKHSGASCYRPYTGQGPCVSGSLSYS